MAWLVAYHATMRAALFVKGRLARTRGAEHAEEPAKGARTTEIADALARTLAEGATRMAGVSIDEAFVRRVARPPHGRVNAAVFERLGNVFGVASDAIWENLFPSRRKGRFEST